VEFTQATTRQFDRGQAKIVTNESELCGDIKTIEVIDRGGDAQLVIEFEWIAINVSHRQNPQRPARWEMVDDPNLRVASVKLEDFLIKPFRQRRIHLGSKGKTIYLYPYTAPSLSKSEVKNP